MTFSLDDLRLGDRAPAELDRICAWLRETLQASKRRGLVVGLSGGIDSSVVASLAVRALGADRVFGLFMNEGESADDTARLSKLIADHLGIATANEDISPILDAAGCYARRDEAIRSVIPRYAPGWKCKIVLPSLLETEQLRVFKVVVRSPDGEELSARMPPAAYLTVVAATSFKQRTRKMLEYFHADRLVYAVAGTPNKLEYDQGFFVKNGDGSADVKPIAHLYKTQVYELAAHLDVPAEIRARPPTTDTYSLPQSQEEFYFSLPYTGMDACLYARDHGISAAEVAAALDLTPTQIERVFKDIDAKRAAAKYLHAPPQTLAI
ncbi:MAG TPA: NAD(+) synthase [Kofleriaceae bacterium]|jgi:NAD+ synthase|nr:NAD(+) synthase [Kofleriaceae bacterium]